MADLNVETKTILKEIGDQLRPRIDHPDWDLGAASEVRKAENFPSIRRHACVRVSSAQQGPSTESVSAYIIMKLKNSQATNRLTKASRKEKNQPTTY